ncbi:MAG: STAS/SEC14 domain-containing protein [Acidobacteriaceae bacterium]
MAGSIQSVSHRGKDIVLVDCSRCTSAEMLPLLDQVQSEVASHPKNSVLILADFCDAEFDKEVATQMKKVLALDRPFVKRAAWVGADKIPKVYIDNFKTFSQRKFPTFATREEAMNWLVSE